MCGLVAWASATRALPEDALDRMTDALAARGPDGRGTWRSEAGRVALGHRRLAIVDRSAAGAQPMSDADGRVHLVCNGEIYNHPALRTELEALGHRYRSDSDSETVLHAWKAWGEDCVHRFRGMFAFALWDARESRLFAARDHVGIKPLYLAHRGDGLALASQPKAFRALPGFVPALDRHAFADYLAYGIVPDERAAFDGVEKLPPGHRLTWQDGRVAIERYWRVRHAPRIVDPRVARERLDAALAEAVGLQLMSDVPLASFLSGGIDSSLVTALAGEARGAAMDSLTVGFDEAASDERAHADVAARHVGTRAHVAVLRREEAPALIDDLVEAFDEPFGMGAALPMLRIARLARDEGFTVVLSGDGADELFAGYHHHDALARRYRRRGRASAERVANAPLAWLTRAALGPFHPLEHYRPHEAMLAPALRHALLAEMPDTGVGTRREDDDDTAGNAARRGRPDRCPRWRERRHFPTDLGAVDAARVYDLNTYLPDEILVKVDRATMAYGVEARVPFLDQRLVELAFAIDGALHHANGERKALLKRVAARVLPASILTTRKKGFSIPLDAWLEADGGAWRREMADAIVDGRLVAAGALRADTLRATLERASPGVTFQLYLAERWARRWLD